MIQLDFEKHLLPHLDPNLLSESQVLFKAIVHLFKGPSKLFRPKLLLATHASFAEPGKLAYQSALALECIHTFSLVHDDLPDMDDADERRHIPSVHKAYGNAQAILAGDALFNLGFDILAHADGTPEQCLKMIQVVSRAIGHKGMTLGQSLDIQNPNSKDDLLACYPLKTGALIESSCLLGAICAEVDDPDTLALIQNMGEHIGIYFQIEDDLFDYTQSLTGKTQQPNSANLVHHIGIEACQKLIHKHQTQAFEYIDQLPNPEPLHQLTNHYLERQC